MIFWSQTLRSWKIWTRQTSVLEDSMQRKFFAENGENFIFAVADGTVKLSGRDQVFRRTTPFLAHPARGEEHNDVCQGESDGSQPLDTPTHDGEARHDFWTIAGNYIHRHHFEPRVNFCVPNEESFPIPLEYIVVKRTTTTLDVLLESRTDDHWKHW